MRTFTVFLSPELETDGYSVTCPAMPGAVSQGEGREETLRDIPEAMELRLEASPDRNAETPLPETPALIAREVAWVLEWRAEEGCPLVADTATITLPAAVAA
jgi:predicted RNase H-like HicB family nuclease